MSSKIISSKMSSKVAKTPSCKVCQDAGKPENIVSSHYVKNLEGKIICPTLLSQNCKYCKKQGHTVRYCPDTNKNASSMTVVKSPPVKAKKTVKPPQNLYSNLEVSSSESEGESENDTPVIQIKPEVKPQVTVKPVIKKTWAQLQAESSSDEDDDDSEPLRKVGDTFTMESGSDKYGYIVTAVTNNGKEIHSLSTDGRNDTLIITWRPRSDRWVNKKYTPKEEQHTRYMFGHATNYVDPHF